MSTAPDPTVADAVERTIRAYDLDAVAYVDTSPAVPGSVRADIEAFADRLGPGALVLEIGSGSGRHALLHRLASVTREGGLLRASFKEDDGEGWSTHGSVRHPRHVTYWRADALHRVVCDAGWSEVAMVSAIAGKRSESWLEVSAVRGSVAA